MNEPTQRELLRAFSTEQLQAELRRRSIPPREGPMKPCDDCIHFRVWTGDDDPPDDYTACANGYAQSVRVPKSYEEIHTMQYGLFRRGCTEWHPSSEA